MVRYNVGLVEKGWGHEEIFVTNDQYCGKILHFKEGGKFSMHFHAEKKETWYVLDGAFVVRMIDTNNASINEYSLLPGDSWTNEPLMPHQVICVKAGRFIEVSTPDSIADNYRVMPGDSQCTM